MKQTKSTPAKRTSWPRPDATYRRILRAHAHTRVGAELDPIAIRVAGTSGRSRRSSPMVVLGLALASACSAPEPEPPSSPVRSATTPEGVSTLTEVTNFGTNPSGLKMWKYVPANMPPNAPLVLALHACTQTAADYTKAGWNELADRLKFYVLYPEQTTSNNALRCFNWAGEYGVPTNLMRGRGENQSMKEMIDKMKADYSIDPARVFISGHSGGGAQAALMLAVWPDIFAAGATIAGIPYDCTRVYNEVTTCLNPGMMKSAMEWGDRVRAAFPGFQGPWPKVSIWQGTSDSVVSPNNRVELLKQWTNVHGINQTPQVMDMVDGYPHKKYQDASGNTQVETYDITGMNHGTPVVPSMMCGMTGQYFLDAHICSTLRIAQFFGLDRTQPMMGNVTVSITRPMNGATVSGTVDIEATATADMGVAKVELYANNALRGTVMSAPYRYSWNTTSVPGGRYTLKAVAFDRAGTTATDDHVSVTVMSGVVDTTPPQVHITAPHSGDTVHGSIRITADATDDTGVARVEFFADGTSIGVATSGPFGATWDASSAAAGSHRISATAYDAAGNHAEDSVMVTVMPGGMDPGPGSAPMVKITSPSAGMVSGYQKVKVTVTGMAEIRVVTLALDGELIGTATQAPYEFPWDAATFPAGMHTLLARGFDASGMAGSDMITVNVIHIPHDDSSDDPGTMTPAAQANYGQTHWGCSAAPGRTEGGTWVLALGTIIFTLSRRRASRRG